MFQNFTQKIFFGNSIGSYLLVMGVILVMLILKRIFSKYLAGLIARLISRKNKPFNKARFQNLVLTPIEYFLVTLAIVIAVETLNYPAILDFKVHKTAFATILEGASNTALIISFIWLCIRLLEYVAELLHEKALLTQDRTDDQLIIFFKDFFKVILVIAGILLIIRFGFGKSVGNLLTGLSIVGAAIALAFRESMENLIASFIIFFDKPFTIGDLVKVQNVTGTVERIGLRSTRLRTTDKTYVTVPNKQMVDSILDNQTLRTQRHVSTILQIGLNTPTQKLKAFIKRSEEILKKDQVEETSVFFSDTGIQSHVITIEYFTSMVQAFKEFQQLRQTINMELTEALEQLQIELAGDKTEIVLHREPT